MQENEINREGKILGETAEREMRGMETDGRETIAG